MTTYGVNARMYGPTPKAAAAWDRLFEWIGLRAGLELAKIPHPPPAPLDDLWARRDLAAVFICGFPYAMRADRPPLIAAPLPSAPDYGGRPIYWTDLICRRDAPMTGIEDCFGRSFGWTVRHSQSGFNAPRRFFADHTRTRGAPLFAQVTGGLMTPRRVVEAVLDGRIDCGPLDGYCHELLGKHEPELASGLRVLARTASAPIPPLMATAPLDSEQLSRLREAFGAVGEARDLAALRDDLCLKGFALPVSADYEMTLAMAREAEALGYPEII